MTSGFDAFSLALFTTLAPAGAVAFVALALARLGAAGREAAMRLDRAVALPFSIALGGFIASATHLGTPANALHVFSGIGRSPLSNEVLAAVTFLLLAGSYWMASFKERFPDALARLWLLFGIGAGCMLVVCTSLAYAVRTVPTWDTPFTPANLVLGALLAGPILGLLCLEAARVQARGLETALVIISFGALIASTIILGMHAESLNGIANNEYTAASLAPHYETAVVAHFALGALGAGAAAWSIRRAQSRRLAMSLRIAASALMLLAVFITRIGFYHLHMTVGF
ncbi:DMSO reductase [Gordonibacter sp. An230]|uniref:dimethyl sulfoxide reductase anchor subunit family protein n=1 Tax=Gordonibacter sp. An230 TaxID=1965592 RepID=UPI000B375492|nr:DmsC/YnfH family molybdoenzyme membrane anchor subunit [Gordonibacter sp. An230]OUO91279.1 DMSO reductase [Gordonibacter sp. An230]